MKKYHVKVAVQILEIYEIEAEDAEIASDDWSFTECSVAKETLL